MKQRKGRDAAIPAASDLSERVFVHLAGSGAMVLGAVLIPVQGLDKVLLGAGAGLFALCLVGVAGNAFAAARVHLERLQIRRALLRESGAVLVTNEAGRVLQSNEHAGRIVAGGAARSPADSLDEAFGLGRGYVDRMIARCRNEGTAIDAVHVGGRNLAVEATALSGGRVLWKFLEEAVPAAEARSQECVALVFCDPEGRIWNANDKAVELLGEVPENVEYLSAGAAESMDSTSTPQALELRNADGWREFALLPASTATRAGRKTEIAEIPASPGLLDVLPVPLLKIAPDGGLLEANPEARSILALGDGPLPPLFELVEGMGRSISDWLADAIDGRGLLKPEIVRAVAPGQELFLQITLGRMADNGETVLVGILNDATELKTLEAQFVQSQKMQAIGQLAGGVAHDFNNLLTAISGHCDLLLLRHDEGDPDYADLIQISQNTNRAASLVGQLLAFSRKQNLKPQPLNLRDTMSDLAHLLNRLIGETIRLDVVHEPGEQVIRADRRQMEQVIVNLVVNARDAMPEGGKINVRIRRHDLIEELVRDRARVPPGDYVAIEVRDTGHGIAPEGLRKIFEPFYTTKRTGEGTGLGLSTAYGIVKQTGGYIFVDSVVGEGTLFSLYFPVHEMPQEDRAEEPVKKPAATPSRGGGVVLLVEDEAPVRAFASRALSMRGYTVLEAGNAEEALKTLEDPTLHVDVFVTDVVMPGMDGPTWVRRAIQDRPDIRTVFVSGYAEEGRAEKQARIPNSVFLPKPFSLQELTSIVNEQFV